MTDPYIFTRLDTGAIRGAGGVADEFESDLVALGGGQGRTVCLVTTNLAQLYEVLPRRAERRSALAIGAMVA